MNTRIVPVIGGLSLAAAMFAAGCADPDDESPDQNLQGDAMSDTPYTGRYEVNATVLENAEHGPQLCTAVAESYPPQCGGPDIAGWDWAAVEHTEEAGTRWGDYKLIGTFDGEIFTLTDPAQNSDPGSAPDDGGLGTPCTEPEGGWQVVDESKATTDAQNAALELAQADDEFAGAWLDQSYIEAEYPDLTPEELEQQQLANDPAKLILNLRFTGDAAAHETEIREVWGGKLCVTQAVMTEDELLDVQQALNDEFDGIQASGVDSVRGVVTATVFVASPELQSEVNIRFGEGVVELSGVLTPIDETG